MNITFQGNPVTLLGKQLQVQDTLPDFTIVGNDLGAIRKADTKGVRIFLTVPSLDTGVCSMEVAKFMEYIKDKKEVSCYAVSMDLPFALDRWCQSKGNDRVVTASDYQTKSFAEATGTFLKELCLLTRAVFVVDANDVVQHVEYVSEIKNEPNYDAVLAVVEKLTK